MERRKFVIGLGALAAGGAAGLGTGAFTSVEANRDIAVETAKDSDAFLALNADGGENTAYTSYKNGQLFIDISGDAERVGQDGSEGLNKNATTTFLQLFEVENQGTNTVGVRVHSADEWGEAEGAADWFVGEHGGGTISREDIQEYDWENPDDDDRILDPGESVWVGIYFWKPETFVDNSETFTYTIEAHTESSATANDL